MSSRNQAGRHRAPQRRPVFVRRTRLRALLAAVVTLCIIAGGAAYAASRGTAGACTRSPVAERALAQLRGYVDWLRTNHVQGYVGEVGWPSHPDGDAWNQVASAWYAAADRDRLWVTAWAAGQWWPRSYRMAVYRLTGRDTPPVAGPQASVVEAHSTPPGALRGVDLSSGAFASGPEGPSWYSASRPGRYGRDYYYDDAADFRRIAATGADIVRLSVTWERLQHRLGAPLDPRELARLHRTLDAAASAGLGVVLDLHGYGDYWVASPSGHRRLRLGTPALPDARFADLWRRLSMALRDSTAVLGYGLMNEPMRLAPSAAVGVRRWEAASQAAVSAIRSTGDQRIVFVSGYGGASPGEFAQYQPRAWIEDPGGLVRYEAHQYFDSDRTGHYVRTFAEETRRARDAGFDHPCTTTR